jgi:hypothetical protein
MATNFDRGVPSSVCGIRITRNNKTTVIGWATGIRIQEAFSQFPIEVLGDVYAKHFEMTRVRVSGSFDRIKLWLQPLSQLEGRPWPQQRGTLEMIRQYASSLELFNLYTGDSIIFVEQYTPTDRSMSVSADTVMMENCSFVARRMLEALPRNDVDSITTPPVAVA